MRRHPDGEVGAAFGAARLARMAVTGESPEIICSQPALLEAVVPVTAMQAVLPQRLARYRRLYGALETEFAAA
jgi:xylulokinase